MAKTNDESETVRGNIPRSGPLPPIGPPPRPEVVSDMWWPVQRNVREWSAPEMYGTVDKPVTIEASARFMNLNDPAGLIGKTLGRIVHVTRLEVRGGRVIIELSPCPKGAVAETGTVEKKGSDDGT